MAETIEIFVANSTSTPCTIHMNVRYYRRARTVNNLLTFVRNQHRRCKCGRGNYLVEGYVWIPTASAVPFDPNSPHWDDLTPFSSRQIMEDVAGPDGVLKYNPTQLIFRLALTRVSEGRQLNSDDSARYNRPKAVLCKMRKRLFQIVPPVGYANPAWEFHGDFSELLASDGSVFIDNTATLAEICDQDLVDTESRVCVIFASPSSFALRSFSSLMSLAYDRESPMRRPEAWAHIWPHVHFLRALGSVGPSYSVLVFDFSHVILRHNNWTQQAESATSIGRDLRAFIADQVHDFVAKYWSQLQDFHIPERDTDDLVPKLLEFLSRTNAHPILVCLHGLEDVLERAQICSFWEPGVHSTVPAILKLVDELLFVPLVASHTADDGVVRKVIITGAHPQVYLGDTAFAHVKYKDVSTTREAHSLHGYTVSQVQRAFELFPWSGFSDERGRVAAMVLQYASKPCRGHWRSSMNYKLTPEVVDPTVPPIVIALLDEGGTISADTVDAAFRDRYPYELYARTLYPLLLRSVPKWLGVLLGTDTNESTPKRVRVAGSDTGWFWTYTQLRTGPRDANLVFAVLATLGLIRLLGRDKSDWIVELAGKHAHWVIRSVLIRIVEDRTVDTAPAYAQLSAEQVTMDAIRNIIFRYLKENSVLPRDEADFQKHLLRILRWIVRYNRQYPQQVQHEFWLRCGSARRCWDRRGDVIMLLRMADGSWRVFIIELKYFALEATRTATLEAVQQSAQSFGRSKEFFIAELERIAMEDGWQAREPTTPPPGFRLDYPVHIGIPNLKAKYKNQKGEERIKSAEQVANDVPEQTDEYLNGAIQGVGEELGEDVPGFADQRFTRYEAATATMTVTFVAMSFLLIGNILLYANQGARKQAGFRPVVAGAFPWTSDPTRTQVEEVLEAKERLRRK